MPSFTVAVFDLWNALWVVDIMMDSSLWSTVWTLLESPIFVLRQISRILIHIILIIIILNFVPIIIKVVFCFAYISLISILLRSNLNISTTFINIFNTYSDLRFLFVTLPDKIWCKRHWCLSFWLKVIILSLYLLIGYSSSWWWHFIPLIHQCWRNCCCLGLLLVLLTRHNFSYNHLVFSCRIIIKARSSVHILRWENSSLWFLQTFLSGFVQEWNFGQFFILVFNFWKIESTLWSSSQAWSLWN